MKSSLPPVHRFLIVPLACCLLFAAVPKSTAAPDDDPINTARVAAKAWMTMIDSGQYEASYTTAGDGLHQSVTQTKWVLVLKSLRPVWGELVSRTEDKHLYQPNGIQGLNGECMVISYQTSFSKMPSAEEMVILRMEDGKWRGVGYTAGPKGNGQAPDIAPPATETSTTVHSLPGAKTPTEPAPAPDH